MKPQIIGGSLYFPMPAQIKQLTLGSMFKLKPHAALQQVTGKTSEGWIKAQHVFSEETTQLSPDYPVILMMKL